jgi:hypothetical protein
VTDPANTVAYVKGALVSISPTGTKQSIPFQYNPDTVRRTIEPNTVGGQPGLRSQAVRFAGAPSETILLDCRFSAAEALDRGDPTAIQYGIAPQLAALALLIYPATTDVQRAQQLLDAGTLEIVPALANRLLFVWGAQRVVPCRLAGYSIVEQFHDPSLSPVMATVSMTLRVLSYSDVDTSNPSYHEFITYQQGLERMGAMLSSGPGQ